MTPAVTAPPAPTVEPTAFRAIMAEFPTCVTVVTSPAAEGPVGCTANAIMSLSLDPPSIVVSLSSTGRTVNRVQDAGLFGVNLLNWSQRELTRRFATGEPCRRFDGLPYRPQLGVPVLPDAAANLVCALDRSVELHDHVLLIGRVVWTAVSGDSPALVFHRNAQHPLEPGPGAPR